ncbi:GGDEF domain-containing protein [Thaumasiovibrio subtropicus]|uniref:GGDEF domain-containing protein n=1 Tax=Thaumasiovibrio subtropicus TaxID=1891207 RepID=UPI000B356553|nr:GGDEF domain-containing protein [Thaumasiovibrio subtropicus]
MANELFEESTKLLKITVPLMIKYQVPTTPTNYALWYTYASQQTPQLNQAIDNTLKQGAPITPTQCDQLFAQHLSSQTERNLDQVKQSLEAMTIDMSHTMTDTLSDTQSFKGAINRTFQRLAKAEQQGLSLEETMTLVRELLQESGNMERSTETFACQIQNAHQEISKLKEALEDSRKEANEDALTGLLNRRAFDNDVDAYFRTGNQIGLLLLDIDHFKKFNDEFGHLLGDQVLQAVGRRLQENNRDGIQAYRYGGEEFAIIVPNKTIASCRQIAETIRKQIDRLVLKDRRRGAKINSITASFGVAVREPGDEIRTFIHRADEQLLKAKQLGRNRVMPLN